MKEDILEDIKRAISSATRAIAENKELEVVFEDTGSSSENYFYEDPPPDLKSVVDYYSLVESNVKPSNIKIIQLSEKVYLSLYYLTGSYKYSNGRVNTEYKTRASNIWFYEDGGFKLYYKNFTNLKKELEPTDIIAYPMD